jgi:L-alanine-DL-glutamate epimerase-like enolase superfamily enzyme
MPAITQLRAEAFDVALSMPFGIARGAQEVARNVLVAVTLDDGTLGLGEAAPFPVVSGETQAQTLASLDAMRAVVVGQDASRWRRLAAQLGELAPAAPAARCAVETAVLDAVCRRAGLSLWAFFGGAETMLTSDITLVTGSVEDTRAAAEAAEREGFSTLKVKVGGSSLGADRERLEAVLEVAPRARLVLDANAAFSAEEALELLASLGRQRSRVVLFEQPTPAGDLAALRRVREQGRVPVAADESAKNARSVAVLARERAADVVNVKITKSGVAEALDMVAAARSAGLATMIGGMVETKLCMTASACLAAGLGGFAFVDLDTPLFLKDSPLSGGYEQRGGVLRLDGVPAGHGVNRRPGFAKV